MTGRERKVATASDAHESLPSGDRQEFAGDDEADEIVGYDRDTRGVGVRDRTLVLPSVICSREVAKRIAARLPGAVAAPHDYGCGQIGADRDRTERTFVGVATNPNVNGVVVVGLGCETIGSEGLAATIAESALPVRQVAIQSAGSTEACIEAGVTAGQELATQSREQDARPQPRPADRTPTGAGVDTGNERGEESETETRTAIEANTEREPGTGAGATGRQATLAELTIGVVPGGFAAPTREVTAPLVGQVVDRLVAANGRVVVAGTERLPPHADAVADRCVDDDVADRLRDLLDTAERSTHAARTRSEAAEYDVDTVTAAWGSAPVSDALAYGEQVRTDGLSVLDAPATIEAAASGLVAAGATVIVHVSPDGVVTGHPIAPVLKLSADPATLAALPEDIDLDARDATATTVLDRLRAVGDGAPVAAERHGLTTFTLARAGPSM